MEFDPPDFWSGSELERIVAACERATDDYAYVVDAHSDAYEALVMAEAAEWRAAEPEAKSRADQDRLAGYAVAKEKAGENRAKNNVKKAQGFRDMQLAKLNAAQSHLRSIVRQS